MKKKLSVFALLVLILSISVACGTATQKEPAGKITLSVTCASVLGKKGAEDAPADGTIYEEEIEFYENDSAFGAFKRALMKQKIQFEADGTGYVTGISNIYAGDFGDASGWLYKVNGETPSVGSDDYKLKNGDKIEWYFSCDMMAEFE